ncbi:hypothetical protein LTR70_003043 [Exophiala xenobiotica]|uniref:Uncharacterized protein n=1 Tax=Lithohypha guttulata TaxID=1690604 RepID=A0ABR0K943_9EURO|nr:hypothetical protein LTR24_005723 [Lithohypha guttulata]KAK5324413.1 hypothetical protein LTR70_003043 [Exophiala xenobiotica]
MAFTDGTHAAYAAAFSSKAADEVSSASTSFRSRQPLGLTPYTARFLEELITWRHLQLYGPFMPGCASVGPSFYYGSSLRHVNAGRLYKLFKTELRNSEVYETIALVAADADISCSLIKKSLRLLKQFCAAKYTSSPWPTANTMADVSAWDDLAEDLVEDLHVLSRHNHPVSQIIKKKTEKLGISVSTDLLPAVRRCKEIYFARLTSTTDVRKRRFDADYIVYMLAPHLQSNDDIGVHMLVQLKKVGNRKKVWKRLVSYVDVQPENKQSSYSQTTSDSYGTCNSLRRVEARQLEKPLDQSDSDGSRVGLIQWETRQPLHATSENEEFVDPLRHLKLGEQYQNAGHLTRLSRFKELLDVAME